MAKRFLYIIFLSVFLFLPIGSYAEKRVALIIGNSEYNSDGYDSLTQPVNDAEAFDKALKSFGFETILLKDGNMQQMLISISNFASIVEGADAAVFYYSGHGNSINHEEYIIPAKTKFHSVALESQFLKLTSIEALMYKAKFSFIFYDACRNESEAEISVNSQTKGFVNKYGRSNNLMICYASKSGQLAYAGNGSKLSPFTEVILDHIYKPENFSTLWFNYITSDSRLSTQPQNNGGYAGEFYFNRPEMQQDWNKNHKLNTINYVQVDSIINGVIKYGDDELFPKNIYGRWGCINKEGNFIIPPNYDYIYHYNEGLAQVRLGNKYGFIDVYNNQIIPCVFDDAGHFSEGVASIGKDGLYGCIDKIGRIVIPIQYRSITVMSSDMIRVESILFKYGYIDKSGNEIIPCVFEYAGDFSEGVACVRKDGKYGYIDKSGNEIIPCVFEHAGDFSEGVASVRKDGKYGIINKNAQVIIECIYEYTFIKNGIIVFELNNKYGAMSLNGDIVVPCSYDYIKDFKGKFTQVKLNGKWGVVDNNGNIITQCIYDKIGDFKEGLAPVKLNGKWGYINEKGIIVIDTIFYDAQPFYNGLAKVDTGEEGYSYINKKGIIICR